MWNTDDDAYSELMRAHESVSKLPKDHPDHLPHYRAFIKTMVAHLQEQVDDGLSVVSVARVLADFPVDVIRLGTKSILRDAGIGQVQARP